MRILIGIGVPALIAGGLLFLYRYGSPFPCFFYQITGWYCPGCGAGRALFSLVHGNFIAALRYNLFFLIASPIVAYYFLKQYIRAVFRRDPLPFFNISIRAYNIIIMIIAVYWILRNIPGLPLAPPTV